MTEGSGRLELGLYLPTWDDEHGRALTWDQLRDLAQLAEAVGFDALWVADHFGLSLGDRTLPFWDGWTILTALAEATHRVTLGPLVTVAAFRHPALIAKMAMTLDEISGGRLILALGAGSDRDTSFRSFGYPVDRRVGLLDEALRIVVPLLRDGHVDFHGKYFLARDCRLDRVGPRPAGPPVWVGGTGPRIQRLGARWADGFHFNGAPPYRSFTDPAVLAETMAGFDAICREEAREPVSVKRAAHTIVTFAGPGADMSGPRASAIHGTVDEIAAQLRSLHVAGVHHLLCSIDSGEERGPLTSLPLLSASALDRFTPIVDLLHGPDTRSATRP